MATANQRAIAICDAIVNGTSTTGQRQRLLAAFGTAPDFIQALREFVLFRITNAESAAPVAQAQSNAAASVLADFQEAP